ncbi:major allergen Pru av 1-like [Actinidia eriantha]|uniref:major allergen Pru av 1-like n=1 Tax=Actinidia eriantha TaxID=165200 RepID=UPI002582E6E4|nr:major allergen Pru av 1-like [Actinidia eriantha]
MWVLLKQQMSENVIGYPTVNAVVRPEMMKMIKENLYGPLIDPKVQESSFNCKALTNKCKDNLIQRERTSHQQREGRGVITYYMEVTSSIPPAKLFKAFILDNDNLVPNCRPQAIKSVEILGGGGRPGTINITTFGEGSQLKTVKQRINEIDKENFTYSYTITEGDALMARLNASPMRSNVTISCRRLHLQKQHNPK